MVQHSRTEIPLGSPLLSSWGNVVVAHLPPESTRAFRATGEFDALTTDLALAALSERQLGKGSATDVLAISLSATDYIGHDVGNQGAEMCVQMYQLDQALGRRGIRRVSPCSQTSLVE